MHNVITPKDAAELRRMRQASLTPETIHPVKRPRRPRSRATSIGVARLNATLLTSDATATIDEYRAAGGAEPSPALTTVDNPYSLSGEDNDLCLVAKREGNWELIVIIEGVESEEHGFAFIDADYTNPMTSPLAITGYESVEGTAPNPLPTSAINQALETRAPQSGDIAAVAKRDGVWAVTRVFPGGEENHGIGRLVDDQLTTSATLNVDGYTPVEGSETFPAGLINNPNLVTGVDNSQVLIAKRAGVWEVVAALDTQVAQQHGIATAYADGWASVDATGDIEDYQAVEGNETPGAEPATIQNPNGIAPSEGDQVLVSKQAGVWNAIAVIKGGEENHGVAQSYAGWDSGETLVDIKSYRAVEGSDTPGPEPATVSNPYNIKTDPNDWVIVTKITGTYTVIAVVGSGDAFSCLVVSDIDGSTWTENDGTDGNSAPTLVKAQTSAWLLKSDLTLEWPPKEVTVDTSATAAVTIDDGTLADGSDKIESGDYGYDADRKYGRVGWGVVSSGKYKLHGLDCFIVPYFDYVEPSP